MRGALAGLGAALALAGGADALQAQRAPGPVRILEAAAAHYAPVTALCADFVQQRTIPLLGEERTGRGRLCQQGRDRFAMRFTDPAGDALVVDGTDAWIYWKSIDPRQVLRLPLESFPGGFDLHREFLSSPGDRYEATYVGAERVAGEATHHIRLRPREAADYRAADVWIEVDRPVLRQVRIEEENGSVRMVTMTSVELGAAAPPGWFTFTPPEGAQVIGR